MKKILSLIGIGGVLVFASCSKPATEQANKQMTFKTLSGQLATIQVSQDHGYLMFKDVTEYENTIQTLSQMTDAELDSWEASLTGFTSAYTAYGFDIEDPSLVPADDKNSQAFDPLFKRIINADGIIQIGSFIFNSRLNEGFVLEMDAGNVSWAWNDFRSANFNSEIMNKFGANETEYLGNYNDVFELLETGVHGINLQTIALFGQNNTKTNTTEETPNANFRVRAENAYQSAVFYFSLITKGKVQWRHTGANGVFGWEVYSNGHIWYANSGTDVVRYKARGINNEEIKTGQYPTGIITTGERKWRAYEGKRGLRYFNFITTTVTNSNGIIGSQNISTTTQVNG
ncbi:hypothetical protein D3C72_817670 [compost metagenome]